MSRGGSLWGVAIRKNVYTGKLKKVMVGVAGSVTQSRTSAVADTGTLTLAFTAYPPRHRPKREPCQCNPHGEAAATQATLATTLTEAKRENEKQDAKLRKRGTLEEMNKILMAQTQQTKPVISFAIVKEDERSAHGQEKRRGGRGRAIEGKDR
ncbi:unnamed protein product [Tuber aestivum]|uniref:Uncharacterized protein n=1 Tax=Tuber aestivum TaxID=59557 RepID=A0A292Q9V5_9PEZI|nr:unnamed protein product [Tuber aestivum]